MKTVQLHIKLAVFCIAVLTAGAPTQIYAGQLLSYFELHEARVEQTSHEKKKTVKEARTKKQQKTRHTLFVNHGTNTNPIAYCGPTCTGNSLTKRAAQRILSPPDTDQKYLLLLKLSVYPFYQSLRH